MLKVNKTATLAIRKKLVAYIKVADDKKIRAVYTLLENELKQKEHPTIEDYNIELAEAEAEVKNANYVTHAAFKKKIKQW